MSRASGIWTGSIWKRFWISSRSQISKRQPISIWPELTESRFFFIVLVRIISLHYKVV